MPFPPTVKARSAVQTGVTHFRLTSYGGETNPPISDEPYTSPGDVPDEQPVPDPGPQDAARPIQAFRTVQRLPMSWPSSR
jgi:hypothetical protein